MDEQEEVELRRLRRQYRILVNDKLAIKCAHGIDTVRQKKCVKQMRKELADLKLTIRRSHRPAEDRQQEQWLKELLRSRCNFGNELRVQKHELTAIDSQIKQVQQRIHALNASKPQSQLDFQENHLQMLENKLDTNVKAYCTLLAENRRLRDQVMSILSDRQIFNERFNKLLGLLQTGKRVLLDVMDTTKTVYEQREEYISKLHVLSLKAMNIYNMHSDHMADMKRFLDAQTSLGKFIRAKGCRRVMADLEAREQAKRVAQLQTFNDTLLSYSQIMHDIRVFVGEEDIHRICFLFLRKETENFGMFNYVNILNNEIETLSDETVSLYKRIQLAQAKHQQMERQQADSLQELELQYQTVKKEAEKATRMACKRSDNLHRVVRALADVFKEFGVTDEPIAGLVRDKGKLNVENVLTYLEIFDGKLGQFLMQGAFNKKIVTASKIGMGKASAIASASKAKPRVMRWALPGAGVQRTQRSTLQATAATGSYTFYRVKLKSRFSTVRPKSASVPSLGSKKSMTLSRVSSNELNELSDILKVTDYGV